LAFLTLSGFGITGMLFAVFADVGVTLIAILNSMRALFFKTKKK
jgi:Cd2+/Zn2+-exporting ATPase